LPSKTSIITKIIVINVHKIFVSPRYYLTLGSFLSTTHPFIPRQAIRQHRLRVRKRGTRATPKSRLLDVERLSRLLVGVATCCRRNQPKIVFQPRVAVCTAGCNIRAQTLWILLLLRQLNEGSCVCVCMRGTHDDDEFQQMQGDGYTNRQTEKRGMRHTDDRAPGEIISERLLSH